MARCALQLNWGSPAGAHVTLIHELSLLINAAEADASHHSAAQMAAGAA